MANTPKFKGVIIDIGGVEYTLPPLSIRAFSKEDAGAKIKQIQKAFTGVQADGADPDITAMMDSEVVEDLIMLVTSALRRNYPDIDEDVVADGISDIMTLFNLFQYLVSQNDEVMKKMEEARKNGLREFVEKKGK